MGGCSMTGAELVAIAIQLSMAIDHLLCRPARALRGHHGRAGQAGPALQVVAGDERDHAGGRGADRDLVRPEPRRRGRADRHGAVADSADPAQQGAQGRRRSVVHHRRAGRRRRCCRSCSCRWSRTWWAKSSAARFASRRRRSPRIVTTSILMPLLAGLGLKRLSAVRGRPVRPALVDLRNPAADRRVRSRADRGAARLRPPWSATSPASRSSRSC